MRTLERKTSGEIVYHTPWTKPHIPFRLTTAGRSLQPKPRIETSSKSFERMKRDCTKVMDEERCKQMTGRDCGDGYRMVATNGHWALIERGKGTGVLMPISKGDKHTTKVILSDPEFYCALNRAEVMADERSRTVTLLGKGERAWLYSSHSDMGDFMEHVPATTNKPWGVCLNLDYLRMTLGCWPLTMWFRDEENAVVFEPSDGAWRFVVMPFRGAVDAVESIITKETGGVL